MKVFRKGEDNKDWEWKKINLVYDECRGMRNRTTMLIKINGKVHAFPKEYISLSAWGKKVVTMPIWLARSRGLVTIKSTPLVVAKLNAPDPI